MNDPFQSEIEGYAHGLHAIELAIVEHAGTQRHADMHRVHALLGRMRNTAESIDTVFNHANPQYAHDNARLTKLLGDSTAIWHTLVRAHNRAHGHKAGAHTITPPQQKLPVTERIAHVKQQMENELRSIERETAQVEHMEDDAQREENRDVLQRQIGSLRQMMLGKLHEVQAEERGLQGRGQQEHRSVDREQGGMERVLDEVKNEWTLLRHAKEHSLALGVVVAVTAALMLFSAHHVMKIVRRGRRLGKRKAHIVLMPDGIDEEAAPLTGGARVATVQHGGGRVPAPTGAALAVPAPHAFASLSHDHHVDDEGLVDVMLGTAGQWRAGGADGDI